MPHTFPTGDKQPSHLDGLLNGTYLSSRAEQQHGHATRKHVCKSLRVLSPSPLLPRAPPTKRTPCFRPLSEPTQGRACAACPGEKGQAATMLTRGPEAPDIHHSVTGSARASAPYGIKDLKVGCRGRRNGNETRSGGWAGVRECSGPGRAGGSQRWECAKCY